MTLELWNFKYQWTYIRCIILFLRDTRSFYTVWKLLQRRKAFFYQARVFVFWYIPFHSINLDFKKCNDLLNTQILFLICPSPLNTHRAHLFRKDIGEKGGVKGAPPAEGSLGRSEVSPQPQAPCPGCSRCASPPCSRESWAARNKWGEKNLKVLHFLCPLPGLWVTGPFSEALALWNSSHNPWQAGW